MSIALRISSASRNRFHVPASKTKPNVLEMIALVYLCSEVNAQREARFVDILVSEGTRAKVIANC